MAKTFSSWVRRFCCHCVWGDGCLRCKRWGSLYSTDSILIVQDSSNSLWSQNLAKLWHQQLLATISSSSTKHPGEPSFSTEPNKTRRWHSLSLFLWEKSKKVKTWFSEEQSMTGNDLNKWWIKMEILSHITSLNMSLISFIGFNLGGLKKN